MSNEPMLHPMSSETSAQAAADPQGADAPRETDAEKVLAALARMEAAVQDERAGPVIERLRDDLGGMAGAIAKAQEAIRPYEEVGALLRDLERRIGAMVALIAPVADAPPAEQAAPEESEFRETQEPQVSAEASSAEVAAAMAELGAATVAEPAAAAEPALEQPDAVLAPVECDQVPTVSNVVSQRGRADAADADTHTAASAAPLVWEGSEVPTVSMLQAMVEALTAQAASTSSEPETADIETAPQPELELRPASTFSESEQIPPPEPLPVLEPAPAPAAFALEPADANTAAVFTTRAPGLRTPIMPENELLSSFARMEVMPFLPPEVGTAVIFSRRPAEAEASAPQAPAAEPAPEPEPAAFLFEPPHLRDDPAAFLLEPEFVTSTQPSALPLPAPAFGLADERPRAAPESQSPRAAPAPSSDPLAALKAMSEAERIALFT